MHRWLQNATFRTSFLVQFMKKTIALTISGLIIMGLLNCSGNEAKSENNSNEPILGMILLEELNSMKIKEVISELRTEWRLEVTDSESSDSASVLEIDGYKIAIVSMPIPIPGNEIKETAEYNFFWENGIKEATKHKAHIVLSVMNAGQNPVKENLLFTKVASSILNNSKSLGVYIGGRTLLLKKDFYLANTEMMSDKDLPVYNWIYFGLRENDGKRSIYTYGLADFKKREIEIINSSHTFEELDELMYDIVHYVIVSDVILLDGETIGVTENQKLEIRESKGKFLDGLTLKINY